MEYELEEYTATKNGKSVTKKRYRKLYGKHRKQEKREQTVERQKEHDKLSLEQKMAKAVPESKEHKRLAEKIKSKKN